MPPPKASDGFFSSIRSFGSSSSAQQPQQQQNDPSSSSYIPNPSTLLVDLAPSLLSSSSRLLHPSNRTAHQASLSSASATSTASSTSQSLRRKLSFLRSGLHAGNPGRPGWAEVGTQLYIRERVDELLRLPIPAAPFPLSGSPAPTSMPGRKTIEPPPRPEDPVPLYAGFKATIPTSQASKLERRKRRALLSEQALGLEGGKLGLKERGDKARGLLGAADKIDEFGQVFGGEDSLRIGRKPRLSRRKRNASLASSLSSSSNLASDPPASRLELEADATAVEGDMANVAVRRALLNGQIRDVEGQIAKLEEIREGLRKGMLGLREEELELEDELEGIQTRLARLPLVSSSTAASAASASASVNPAAASSSLLASSSSSRRRKGPAFLPSEHDELPPGVAFMTLHGHLSPLLSLDFSEPYGTLVTSSADASVRLWDLTTGEETGFLKGHDGHVKVLQVEGGVAVTGGKDGGIRVWDLERAEEDFFTGRVARRDERDEDVFSAAVGGGGGGGSGLINGNRAAVEDDGLLREPGEKSVRDGEAEKKDEKEDGPCVRVLDGHTKAVTSLYFDGPCLVTGSSDSTLRQWDLTTGQCVQTMDILWAISNPLPSSSTLYPASSHSPSQTDPFSASFSHSPPSTPRKNFGALRRQSSLFDSSPGAVGASPSTTSYADGSWEPYEDFVGGVQFWGYALASGTADGCVRMWDMRTGQAHRTLVGHTGPVTCVQFDEMHLVSGSLDKSIRIWDLRTGSISDTIRYDHPVTALQFDSRKIVAAAGENGVK
ncbi:hypothetical protein JCM21900_000688, partial [Sporobolomyces salmonicolor]